MHPCIFLFLVLGYSDSRFKLRVHDSKRSLMVQVGRTSRILRVATSETRENGSELGHVLIIIISPALFLRLDSFDTRGPRAHS